MNPAGSLFRKFRYSATAVSNASRRSSILDKQFIVKAYQCDRNMRFPITNYVRINLHRNARQHPGAAKNNSMPEKKEQNTCRKL